MMRRTRDLERDEIGMNRHRALGYCLSMIFSENRGTLFRIMLYDAATSPPGATLPLAPAQLIHAGPCEKGDAAPQGILTS
jgi:hypothetical protein